jgi:DtxR family Mn-dependent transcriptional regulator
MLPDEEHLTPALGVYLLAIERLSQEQARATTKELATFLGVNQSTVTETLKRLAEKGWINYEWRAGCALTPLGAKLVRTMLRRQRLLKTFMVKQLDYKLTDVYKESLAMQHTLSERFTEALDEFLGFPSLDPHGEIIPRPHQESPAPNHRPLTGMAEGQRVQVCHVPDWRSAQLDYLYQLGIVPGTLIHLLRVPPLNEPLLLEIAGETVAISTEIGRWIGVCPVL